MGTGEAMVKTGLGNSGRIDGAVVIPSTSAAFVLVPVSNVVIVLETVVLSLNADVSETEGETGLKVVLV